MTPKKRWTAVSEKILSGIVLPSRSNHARSQGDLQGPPRRRRWQDKGVRIRHRQAQQQGLGSRRRARRQARTMRHVYCQA
eukprot:6896742-Prymnesium_polylepis.1